MRRPPTITCGRALQTGRIRPRASDLSASLCRSQDGDLQFAGRAALQAGDPDGYAADFAGALPPEPADLTEPVEPAGMWTRAGAGRRGGSACGRSCDAPADETAPIAGAAAMRADDTARPTAGAAVRRAAGPCVQIADVPAPRQADDTALPIAGAVAPQLAGPCAQLRALLRRWRLIDRRGLPRPVGLHGLISRCRAVRRYGLISRCGPVDLRVSGPSQCPSRLWRRGPGDNGRVHHTLRRTGHEGASLGTRHDGLRARNWRHLCRHLRRSDSTRRNAHGYARYLPRLSEIRARHSSDGIRRVLIDVTHVVDIDVGDIDVRDVGDVRNIHAVHVSLAHAIRGPVDFTRPEREPAYATAATETDRDAPMLAADPCDQRGRIHRTHRDWARESSTSLRRA